MVRDINADGTFEAKELFYYFKDHLNSVHDLTDNEGRPVQRYNDTAYGRTTIEKTAKDPRAKIVRTPYAYTSREWEQENGDYYYRARNYDPRTGRFLSEDPIGFKGKDLNLYRYVRNNPLRYSDPSGLFSSSGESERAKCRRETLERYYKEHQDGNLQCENTLESSMSYCDSIPEEPKTIEDLLGDPENEL